MIYFTAIFFTFLLVRARVANSKPCTVLFSKLSRDWASQRINELLSDVKIDASDCSLNVEIAEINSIQVTGAEKTDCEMKGEAKTKLS